MSEHVLTWRKGSRAAELGEAALRLIDMPQGLRRSAVQIGAAESLGDAARAVLLEAVAALRVQAQRADGNASVRGEPIRIPLKALDPRQREVVGDLLGEGEVQAEVGGAAHWKIRESVLPGLWRVEMDSADERNIGWLEVGVVPSAVLQAAERLPRDSVGIPDVLPAGAMNVRPLITELVARSQAWRSGDASHVINFTLLPITDVDAEILTATVGQIPLNLVSEGYGSCRIYATGLRHVWAVQYLNSMGKVILDTLEVCDIPVAACAAREDFVDSAARLTEMLEAYAS